ncbi:hypothetical protein FRC15_001465 [Serendipita sp. 397]|nr:hypothetical protein FRC15_001465 [Serendipita sp. 397]KAG8792304.1 hypothetical protein FRC16_011464 [Serendipita sp. 398]
MNPSFGTSHIRDMTSIFVDKSAELRDVLMSRLTSKEGEGEVKLDILSYLSRATLDIIGLAGFDYSFNTLANEEDGLAKSFKKLFQPGGGFPIAQLLKAQFPILRSPLRFDQQSKCADDVHRRMTEIGKRLIETKKEEVKQQKSEGSLLQGTKAKDLLSLLIFSNLDDMADASKALTDDEVLHQIPTFLLAGHETTSTATAWTLLSLADNPEVQKRLRDEMLNINTESPTMEELNSLPYLEAVVRESLRYHAVVSGVIRVATEDDIIPLDKPFVDTTGKVQNSIMISQGDTIYLPIRYLNTAPSIWGDDGKSFNPERWNAVSKETSAIPGVWGSQLTFLGGPRACIGYRFALVEMKALLFFLVGNFEFKLAVPVEDIGRHPGIVTRPAVLSELEKGIQLPLVVRPFVRDA